MNVHKKLDKKHFLVFFYNSIIIFFGLIFIYASIDKIAFPERFEIIIQSYNILPLFLTKIFAFIIPWMGMELLLGIFLVVRIFITESAFILSTILVGFITAILIKSSNGPIQNCGCFSLISSGESENIIILLLRDFLFLLLGLSIIFKNKILNKMRY